MRSQVMTVPGVHGWNDAKLAVADLVSHVRQIPVGRYLRESMLVLGVLALMSVFTVGTIVFVACTVAQTVAGAN